MRNQIGKRIAELRKSFCMNQEELASKLGVTFQAISKWETGATYPDIELLPIISQHFHVSVDYLLLGDEMRSRNYYDQRYRQEEYYWGFQPSDLCYLVLKSMPPIGRLRLLDLGCGEGKDAVFFARNGYDVTAFDLAESGIEKTVKLAEQIGVEVNAFVADINAFRLDTQFDIIYSNGVLNYIPPERRKAVFENYQRYTADNGINILSAFITKPFIESSPEKETNSFMWHSGELFSLYRDWRLDVCEETIFDCLSSGIPHKHAVNRILAKKVGT